MRQPTGQLEQQDPREDPREKFQQQQPKLVVDLSLKAVSDYLISSGPTVVPSGEASSPFGL